MRILWSSNGMHVPTGYGVQARHVLPAFQRAGHQVAQFAWYGIQGARMKIGDIVMYPPASDPWGSDIIGAHVEHFRADLVISVQDIWVLPMDYKDRIGVPWMPWFPVDQSPVPERVLMRSDLAEYPLVYSRWGVEQMRAAGREAIYVPCGYNAKAFHPVDAKKRSELRRELGWGEDEYVLVMVAANKGIPSRKGFPEALRIFKAFHDRHPEARLYLHTVEDTSSGGVDFKEYMAHIKGFPTDRVEFVDQYLYRIGLPEEYMAAIYNAGDVLLYPSWAEGFGIPLIEAQACGMPVVTNRCTSMPELTFAGHSVEPLQAYQTPLGGFIGIPDVDGFVEALEDLYQRRGDRTLAEQAVAGAGPFSWDVIIPEYWLPLLDRVERDLPHARRAA